MSKPAAIYLKDIIEHPEIFEKLVKEMGDTRHMIEEEYWEKLGKLVEENPIPSAAPISREELLNISNPPWIYDPTKWPSTSTK